MASTRSSSPLPLHITRRADAADNLLEILVGPALPRLAFPLPGWDDIVSSAARPGTGGRRKRVDLGFEIEATRELREHYGAPEEVTHQGSQLLIWEMDSEGDGIIAARLSSLDVQKGETALGQIHNGIALAAAQHLKPALALVAMRTSGGKAYDHRVDFTFIRHQIASRALRWVCYREPDRVAREPHAAYSFYRALETTNTDLYLCSLGRKVDWSSQSDKLMIGTLGVIGEFERGAIKARTHGAIIARFLETGRGYPGFKRIGFRRNSSGFLEQDAEQWPYALEATTMYSRLKPDGGTSIRGLQVFLEEKLGFKISRESVRKMLKDPIFVTGMAHVNYQGGVYPIRPIELVNPVPVHIFEHNQRLMSVVKGRQRKHRLVLGRFAIAAQRAAVRDEPAPRRTRRHAITPQPAQTDVNACAAVQHLGVGARGNTPAARHETAFSVRPGLICERVDIQVVSADDLAAARPPEPRPGDIGVVSHA